MCHEPLAARANFVWQPRIRGIIGSSARPRGCRPQAAQFDILPDQTYDIGMNRLRNWTVAVSCWLLALPLSVFLPCCCGKGSYASHGECTPPESGSCCSVSKTREFEPCCRDTRSSNCHQCKCLIRSSGDAVVARDLKHPVDVASVLWPGDFCAAAPFRLINDGRGASLLPVSHNRMQARLCVWLK